MAVLAVVFLNVLEGHSGQRVVVGVIFLGLSLAYTAQALKLNPANFGRKVMRKWFARGPKGRELREGELSLPPQPIGPDDFEGEDSLDEESLDGDADSDSVNEEPVGWGKISLTLLAGFIGLVGGAELMVIGGKNIAVQVGISERFIALTIVAIGTSLPELAASIAAARKGHPELAVGNVVGSCLFNLSFVLGVAAIAAPITVDVDAMKWDFLLMMGLTIMMFVLLWSDRQLSRVEGAVLLSIYLAFMGWVSYRHSRRRERTGPGMRGPPWRSLCCTSLLKSQTATRGPQIRRSLRVCIL